jgi:hypothetical protein
MRRARLTTDALGLPMAAAQESKPENIVQDLRIPAPFAELTALADTVDVDAEVRSAMRAVLPPAYPSCERVFNVVTAGAGLDRALPRPVALHPPQSPGGMARRPRPRRGERSQPRPCVPAVGSADSVQISLLAHALGRRSFPRTAVGTALFRSRRRSNSNCSSSRRTEGWRRISKRL